VLGESRARCSRCGESVELHLVTLPYQSERRGGRILVYCRPCRDVMKTDVSIPLELVTAALFVGLYRLGFTDSAPDTAAQIVFGDAVPRGVVRRAKATLDERLSRR
jgi:hypothetical protein